MKEDGRKDICRGCLKAPIHARLMCRDCYEHIRYWVWGGQEAKARYFQENRQVCYQRNREWRRRKQPKRPERVRSFDALAYGRMGKKRAASYTRFLILLEGEEQLDYYMRLAEAWKTVGEML